MVVETTASLLTEDDDFGLYLRPKVLFSGKQLPATANGRRDFGILEPSFCFLPPGFHFQEVFFQQGRGETAGGRGGVWPSVGLNLLGWCGPQPSFSFSSSANTWSGSQFCFLFLFFTIFRCVNVLITLFVEGTRATPLSILVVLFVCFFLTGSPKVRISKTSMSSLQKSRTTR